MQGSATTPLTRRSRCAALDLTHPITTLEFTVCFGACAVSVASLKTLVTVGSKQCLFFSAFYSPFASFFYRFKGSSWFSCTYPLRAYFKHDTAYESVALIPFISIFVNLIYFSRRHRNSAWHMTIKCITIQSKITPPQNNS